MVSQNKVLFGFFLALLVLSAVMVQHAEAFHHIYKLAALAIIARGFQGGGHGGYSHAIPIPVYIGHGHGHYGGYYGY